MLKNAYFLAKIGADTVENERNFAKSLPQKNWHLPYPSARTRRTGASGERGARPGELQRVARGLRVRGPAGRVRGRRGLRRGLRVPRAGVPTTGLRGVRGVGAL